jgi:hypothetical protein
MDTYVKETVLREGVQDMIIGGYSIDPLINRNTQAEPQCQKKIKAFLKGEITRS